MAKFQYTATNVAGRTIDGLYEAQDRRGVVDMLRARSYYPLRIAEVKTGQGLNRELGRKIPLKDLSLFCQQFSTILSSGIAVGQALDILAQQTENKRLQRVLRDVYEKVLTGRSLTDSFEEHADRFPSVFMSMLRVGEVSGTLEGSLKRLHGYFRQEYNLSQKFKTAMVYPAIVSCLALVIVTFLLIFIVPTFQGVFENAGATLPKPTLVLLAMSNGLRHHYPVVIAFVLAVIVLFYAYQRSPGGKVALSRLSLVVPAFGPLNRKLLVSRFTRTLSTMTASGVPLTQALDITSRVVANPYVEQELKAAQDAIQQGVPLYRPLGAIAAFPPMVIQMTRLGEESGQLDYMLEQTAVYYDSETETAIARLTAAIEPAIIIVLGGMVLFVVLSILLPTFRMASLVGGLG